MTAIYKRSKKFRFPGERGARSAIFSAYRASHAGDATRREGAAKTRNGRPQKNPRRGKRKRRLLYETRSYFLETRKWSRLVIAKSSAIFEKWRRKWATISTGCRRKLYCCSLARSGNSEKKIPFFSPPRFFVRAYCVAVVKLSGNSPPSAAPTYGPCAPVAPSRPRAKGPSPPPPTFSLQLGIKHHRNGRLRKNANASQI